MWTNIIMMRYADVLMYAEAKAYLNEMDAAVERDDQGRSASVQGWSAPTPRRAITPRSYATKRRVELALEDCATST